MGLYYILLTIAKTISFAVGQSQTESMNQSSTQNFEQQRMKEVGVELILGFHVTSTKLEDKDYQSF